MRISDNTKGLLYITGAGFIWGILAIIIKVTVNYIPPKTIAWSRFFIAFILLSTFHLINRKSSDIKIFTKPPLLVIVSAICLAFNYIFYMEGIHATTPNNAAIFIQSGPLLLAIFGFVIYKEKLRLVQIMGFIIAFIGFSFFYHDQLASIFSNPQIYNKGVLFIVFAGVLWAFYSLIQKELVKKYKADYLNLINFGLPVFILLPGTKINVFVGIPWFIWILVIFLGLSTLIAYHLLSLALKYTEANKISIILTSSPVITFVVMAIITSIQVSWMEGEIFSLLTLLGAFLVVSGAIIVTIFKGKK